MGYAVEFSRTAEDKLLRLKRKNRVAFHAVENKLRQVAETPYRFKPLKTPLQGVWRVHIDSSFVLLYSVDEDRKTVIVQNYAHHDEAYNR